jgi:general secretion pathway protein G
MHVRSVRHAFTLVDLMIVIVILGILAAAVIPVLTGHLERAQTTAATATHAMVRKALDLYFQRHETWPAQITADMFQPPETVTMPRGYQLQYNPDSGELDLLTVADEALDEAPAVVLVE